MILSPTTTANIKNFGYIPAFLLGLSYENYTILAVFMGVDVLTGLIKAYKANGGSSIKSKKIQVGVLSKACILIVPIVIVWAGRGVELDFLWFAKGSLGMLVLAEAYSIIGNVHAIARGKEKSEFDALSFVLNKIKHVIEGVITERQ